MMIVRILGEGQYRLDADVAVAFDTLDADIDTDLHAADEAALRGHLDALTGLVRLHGQALADDELAPSDVVLPPGDATLEELRSLLAPDSPVGV